MEKVIKLYTYVDGVNDTPFPNATDQVEIGNFNYSAKRMGGAPTITASVMYPHCLDDLWTKSVYAMFNGTRYYLKQTPTSSYSNEDARYKHDLELVSDRIILDNVYFYDVVVGAPQMSDKPASNSTKVVFSGNIHEFAARLNASLKYRGLGDVTTRRGFYVVVDADVNSSEEKLVSFEDAFFSTAIQEIYNTYNLLYYFVGYVIHIGNTSNVMPIPFAYGVDDALLSITKTNANYKVVNRATGMGSSDNIPFYYPNDSPKGELWLESSNSALDVRIVDAEKFANYATLDEPMRYVKEGAQGSGLEDRWSSTLMYNVKNDSDVTIGFTIDSIYITNTSDYTIRVGTVVGNGNHITPFEGEYTHGGYTLEIFRDGVSIGSFGFADNQARSLHLEMGMYKIRCYGALSFYNVEEDTPTYSNLLYIDTNISLEGLVERSYWAKENGGLLLLDSIGLRLVSGTPNNGDTLTQRMGEYIKTSTTLVPPIYRETNGDERFYEAINGEYVDDNGNAIVFNNPFIEGRPSEHIVKMDDIKPTIKEKMVNGVRIDKFLDVAFDLNDNNETYVDDNGNTNYLHPYFFVKLHRMDFNLFDHAIEGQSMIIAVTSGDCGACEFEVSVDEDTQKNTVQVDASGNLVRDENGRVMCGVADFQDAVHDLQDRQQDTINYEVWIALKKEENTYGIIMPHAPRIEDGVLMAAGHRPTTNDTFVILGINLPKAYILAAEERLEKEIIKYLRENNDEKFTFSITFSRIFFEENPSVLALLNENSRMTVTYNNKDYTLYVSSFSYNMAQDEVLPQINVDLDEELTINQNTLQKSINQVKVEVGNALQMVSYMSPVGMPSAVMANVATTITAPMEFKKGISFGEGGLIEILDNNSAKLTIDYLDVTKKATFNSLEIQEKTHVGGQLLVTPASIVCGEVEVGGSYYRCYFQTRGEDGEEIFNQFKVGDQAICQTYNTWGSRYYWRLVVGTGSDYVDLSKSDCDEGSDIPMEGDRIVQLGNRYNEARQNAIAITSYGSDAPSIVQYSGISSFEIIEDSIVTKLSPWGNLLTGKVVMRADSMFTKANGEKTNLSATLEGMQQQIDGAITTWFYDPIPTLENYPAIGWESEQDKILHLGDLYYSGEGRVYRFQRHALTFEFVWVEIVDSDIAEALRRAKDAQDTADSKRTIFTSQPIPPYQVGDLWVNATIVVGEVSYDNDILRCNHDRELGESFSISDWGLASSYGQDISQLRDDVNGAIKDGIIDEAERLMLRDSIKTIETTVSEIEEAYSVISITVSGATLENLSANKAAFLASANALIAIINGLLDTSKVMTEEERELFYTSFDNAYEAFNNAYRVIVHALENITSTRITSLDYLKRALKEETTIEGGLIQSSALVLGYTYTDPSTGATEYRRMAGTNGMYDHTKPSGGVSSWWGGEMVDIADYYDYDSSNGQWARKSGVNPPNGWTEQDLLAMRARGVVRFDGSAYFANGNLWWDENGLINGKASALMFGSKSMQNIIDEIEQGAQSGITPRYSRWEEGKQYLNGVNDESNSNPNRIKDFVNRIEGNAVVAYACKVNHTAESPFDASKWEVFPYQPMIATDIFLATKAAINNLYVEELKTEQDKYNQISIENNEMKVNDSNGDARLFIHGGTMTTPSNAFSFSISSSSFSKTNINANTTPKNGTTSPQQLATFTLSERQPVVFPAFEIQISSTLQESTNLPNGGMIGGIQIMEYATLKAFIKLDGTTIASAINYNNTIPSTTIWVDAGQHTLSVVYEWGFNINGNGTANLIGSTRGGIYGSVVTSSYMTEIANNGFRTMWGNNKKFEVKNNGSTMSMVMQNGDTTMEVKNEGIKINNEFATASPTIKRIQVVADYPPQQDQDPNTLYIKTS